MGEMVMTPWGVYWCVFLEGCSAYHGSGKGCSRLKGRNMPFLGPRKRKSKKNKRRKTHYTGDRGEKQTNQHCVNRGQRSVPLNKGGKDSYWIQNSAGWASNY